MNSASPAFTLGELAERLQGSLTGDPRLLITSVSGVEDARPGSLVRADEPRYVAAALAGPGAALLVGLEVVGELGKPAIQVRNPRLAFALLLEMFEPERRPPPGIHPTAVVGEGAQLGSGCAVLPYAILGAGARLGNNVVIHAHCVIGERARIGDDTVLYPHAVVYPGVTIGARCRIHAGAVVGADGFGYVWDGSRHRKIPQVGRVEIGDEVEIGANSCLDRATTGASRVGAGTKIDNLVQIGHNVQVGERCLIAAQTGIAGSARVGDGVVIGGQVGVKDHVTIGAQAQVAGCAQVWGNVPAGQVISGAPARPHRENVRHLAALRRVPEALEALAQLEQRLRELERRLTASEPDETTRAH